MHEKNLFTILWNYLTYLQNGKVAYCDLHVTLLTEFKEFTIHCDYLLTEKKNNKKNKIIK